MSRVWKENNRKEMDLNNEPASVMEINKALTAYQIT